MANKDPGTKALELVTQVNRIGFTEFTTDLVRDVYTTIVSSSMEQLKSYADFVRQISKSLADYQKDIIGKDAAAEKATADSYIKDVFGFDPTQANKNLTNEEAAALKEHFAGITRTSAPATINDAISTGPPVTISMENLRLFVIEKLKSNAENSYELLKTILKIGMQKIVVSDGLIETKLTFSVDSTDYVAKTTNTYSSKASGWGISGSITGRYGLGGIAGTLLGNFIGGGVGGGYSSRKLNVSVVNETSVAAVNLRVDVIGNVRIQFRTETFPAPPIE